MGKRYAKYNETQFIQVLHRSVELTSSLFWEEDGAETHILQGFIICVIHIPGVVYHSATSKILCYYKYDLKWYDNGIEP